MWGSWWSACPGSPRGTNSYWGGSTPFWRRDDDDRAGDGAARADASPLPGRGGLHRARRREPLLRGLRLGRTHGVPPADVVDHPLAALEDADSVPRAPLPRDDVRRSWQRSLGPTSERIRGARV